MGRPSKGLRVEWRRGIGYARFTHAGREQLISTGKRDSGEAQAEAERLYRRVVGGAAPRPASVAGLRIADLTTLFSEWLSSQVGQLDEETLRTYEVTYCGKHWLTHYRDLPEMTSKVARERYRAARLKAATAKTVKKEVWAQDKFLRWCVETDIIDSSALPPRLLWAKSAMGTRTGPQREHARELAAGDVGAFLMALPEWRKVGHRALTKKTYPIRDRFVVAYETGLRPATLSAIVWGDIIKGGAVLRVRAEADKIRYQRDVPLSPVAMEALARVKAGADVRGLATSAASPIFGKHSYGKTIARAAKAAGLDGVAPYDLRHARATHLADAGAAITGIGYLVGHKQATTTNRYLHQSERAAHQALSVSNPVRTDKTSEETGWPTGFEPAPTGATRQLPAAGTSGIRLDCETVSGTSDALRGYGPGDAAGAPATRAWLSEAVTALALLKLGGPELALSGGEVGR